MQERGRQTREGILDAAARLFADRGYAGTTVQDILDRAKATKGSFYHHFQDKEGVAHAVVTESFITDAVPQTIVPRLQAVVDASIILAVLTPRVPVVRAACRLATEQDHPSYGHLWKTYIPMVAGWLAESRDLDELQPGVDPQATAAFWVDAYTGVDMRFRYEYQQLPQEIAQMNMQVVRGIATPETMMLLDVSVGRGEMLVEHSPWAAEYLKSAAEPVQREAAPAS
jgi:AcrR family transcriptional regulator